MKKTFALLLGLGLTATTFATPLIPSFEDILTAAVNYAKDGKFTNYVCTKENFNNTSVCELVSSVSYPSWSGTETNKLYKNKIDGILTTEYTQQGSTFYKFGASGSLEVKGVNNMYMAPAQMYMQYKVFKEHQ